MKPTPVDCDAYCCCPACFGPGRDKWIQDGRPTNCTDGKVHLMGRPGCPVVKENKDRMPDDIDAFAKSICEVQPMPDDIISNIINVIGDKTLVITPKEPCDD